MTNRAGSNQTPQRPGTVNLGDYLRILYRRRWSAGLALLVVFTVGAFRSFRQPPVYEAVAQLLIEKDARRAASMNEVLTSSDAYDDDFSETQYHVLQSRALAARSAEKVGLKPGAPAPVAPPSKSWMTAATEWVMNAAGAPKRVDPPPADETTAQSALTSSFLGGLSVVGVRNTHLVELHYRSPDPVFAAKAANAVAEEYIAQTLADRYSTSKETIDYLDSQIDEQRAKVAQSEKAVQDYLRDNDAVGVDDRQNAISQRQADVNGSLTKAKADRIEKEELLKTLTSLQNDRGALEAMPIVMSNDLVTTIKAQIAVLHQKKADLSTRFKEGAPAMLDIDRQIKDAEAKLQGEIDKVIQSVRADYLGAQGRERQFTQELANQNAEAMRLSRKGVDYAALKDEATSNRTQYENLLARQKEAGVAGQFKGTNIQIVDRAETPRWPVLPNTSRDLFTALFLGCVCAVGLAFGFEYLDSRIRTPDEIKTHLGLPFLGIVPALNDKSLGDRSPLISDAVPPTFVEAIRGMRTAVVFSSAEEGARSIVVTSTAPGEGKTLISTNLAVALAQADQRTLIIDGDMRRPRVHEVFKHLQEPGLSNVLVGTAELHSAICRTNVPNLFLLAAGHIPPNPAELLGSAKYRETIQDLRHQFDSIIIDAPPVMAVTDAVVVASGATGVVFVVGAEMTSRRHAAFAVEQLNSVKAHFIGAVLNRADVQRHGYYYSTYYRKDYTQTYTRTS